jgi:hypothetical protein
MVKPILLQLVLGKRISLECIKVDPIAFLSRNLLGK